MRPNSPRIPVVAPEHFTEEQAALVGSWSKFNFARMMVNHTDLYRAFMPFGERLMGGSSLPHRDREILILRTVGLCNETYEAAHHRAIARNLGLTEAESEAAGTGAPGLPPADQILVKAAEELVGDHCLGDETWRTLSERYSVEQLIELVFLVGNFAMLSMLTNSVGMPCEPEFR
jgi:4-carboxymuconolactone decarboxylase